MALATAFLSEDQFSCSICLEVFNNPVSTPCGHSFCQACISSYWNRGGAKSYQCPLCKECFRHRPELQINRTLKEITEQFKQMSNTAVLTDGRGGGGEGGVEDPNSNTQQHLHPTLSQPQRPGEMPEGVLAEMMTRFQRLSSSEAILTTPPHTSDPQSRNPSQVNAQLPHQSRSIEHADPPPPYSPPRRYSVCSSGESSLNLPLCPIHLRGLELFCRTDNTCVCRSCVETTVHRGHNITPAKREWQIRKSQLGIAEVELKDLISERERKVEEIHNSLREIQAAAERETTGAVVAFSALISSLERCQAEILEMIEMSRQAAAHRAQSLLKDLEEEIAGLKKRSAALSQLSVSEDYVLFLKMFPAVSTSPPMKEWSGVSVSSELTSGVILRAVNSMSERLQEEMRKLSEICQRPSLDQSVPRPNPKTRRVQEYAADITLDHNTAHPRLIISADAKQVHCGDRHQLLADNPERFDRVVCVLGHQGFNSGRHYWEVQVGGKTDWDLGVACRSVNRKGKITVSPAHGYWFLSLRDRNDYAFRTEPSTSLTVNLRPSRIGVYVDCDKGAVSFYNVEARVLIYTFTDCFPDVIHPFFSPCTNKSGRNEAPLIICPPLEAE